MRHQTSRKSRHEGWLALAGLLLVLQARPAPAAEATPASPASEAGIEVDAGDLTRLVAPVALYPDPLLALILQASVQPVQVVQAERFLGKRSKDPTLLTPNPDWDPSILGLLNYPALIGSMNEYLDWTETVGNAVVDRLPEVQAAIQQIRWSAYQAGLLGSTEHQQVTIAGDLVRIMPTDADQVAVPKYDPGALLAAIAAAPVPAVQAEPAPTAPAEPATTGGAQSASEATPAPPPPAPAAEAPVQAEAPPASAPAPVTAPEPAYTEPAAAASYAAPVAAPAYVAPAPTYAGPPVVSYAEPQSTFWSSAATFTGGAVIGGMLGYAIGDDWFDDDDDIDVDWDDLDIDEDDLDELRGRRGGVNIEDSTVIVGGRVDRDRVQAELRNRRGGANVAPRSSTRVQAQAARTSRQAATVRPKGVAPARAARTEPVRATRQVAVPNSTGTASGAAARTAATARTATSARPTAGVAAGVGQGHAARKEAQRGSASRAQAQNRSGAPAPRAAATATRPVQPRAAAAPARPRQQAAAPARQASRQAAPARRTGGGGAGLATGFAGGDKVRQQADRGRASRGGGRAGGRRG